MVPWGCAVDVFLSRFLSMGHFLIIDKGPVQVLYDLATSGAEQRALATLSSAEPGSPVSQKVVDVILSYRRVGHQTLFS